MVNKLLPDQISKFWPIIKYAVEQSLPPIVIDHPDKLNRILAATLSGKLEVWASYKHLKDGTIKFNGIVITQILYDEITLLKSLLIYSVYAYEDTSYDTWSEAYNSIGKYAKSQGCVRFVAYVSAPSVLKIVHRLGGDTSFTFISVALPSSFND
jgi:hypothetical protein